jgi:hypothetical protein
MPQARKTPPPERRKRYKALPDPVTGTSPPTRDGNHMDGFNAAIEAALRKVEWPRGRSFATEVQLRVVVSRYNPGRIDEYRATFVPTGDAI